MNSEQFLKEIKIDGWTDFQVIHGILYGRSTGAHLSTPAAGIETKLLKQLAACAALVTSKQPDRRATYDCLKSMVLEAVNSACDGKGGQIEALGAGSRDSIATAITVKLQPEFVALHIAASDNADWFDVLVFDIAALLKCEAKPVAILSKLNEVANQAAQASEISNHYDDLIRLVAEKLGCQKDCLSIEKALAKISS